MKEQGSGLLLQIVSNSAFTGSIGQTNYAASKAGVMGMLYAWDTELKRYGIRSNALWPIAETDMTQVVIHGARQRAASNGQPEPTAKQIGFGTPSEVADIVVYMCSERADHLRSQLMTFNGSKLAVWHHPHEAEVHRQPAWTIDQIDAVLHDAAAPVFAPEF
jgi:NAD(P)-dependent dehydrogenase (short-subunit alcohol dehydrogenase family)